jgi:hypothetical protein
MRHLALNLGLASLFSVLATSGLAQTDQLHRQGDGAAEHHDRVMSGMRFDQTGMVMNANSEELPRDCAELAGDVEFTVYVGKAYASDFPGTVFGMSQHEYRVPPCSRVTVTLVNEDEVRHQWMLHGLPRYLYPQGMFHLEAAGGQTQTGSFIVPSDDQTYLVHCDMTQHMEKGMKGQLIAGTGSGNLWSIPGVSREFRQQQRVTLLEVSIVVSMAVMSFLVLAFLGTSVRNS